MTQAGIRTIMTAMLGTVEIQMKKVSVNAV
jgi:hypothetical protein